MTNQEAELYIKGKAPAGSACLYSQASTLAYDLGRKILEEFDDQIVAFKQEAGITISTNVKIDRSNSPCATLYLSSYINGNTYTIPVAVVNVARAVDKTRSRYYRNFLIKNVCLDFYSASIQEALDKAKQSFLEAKASNDNKTIMAVEIVSDIIQKYGLTSVYQADDLIKYIHEHRYSIHGQVKANLNKKGLQI